MNSKLLTSIKYGQKYVDEPIYVKSTVISQSIKFALKIPLLKPLIVGYERINLRWMRPDNNGELVPR